MAVNNFMGADMIAQAQTLAVKTMTATFEIQAPNKTNNGFGKVANWTTVANTVGKIHPLSASEVPSQYYTEGRKLYYLILPFNTVIDESHRVVGSDGTVFSVLGVNQPKYTTAFTLTCLVSTPDAQSAT